MSAPLTAARVQAYFRDVAGRQYEAERVPPFTLFFHPHDPLVHYNYAVPDEPPAGDLAGVLGRVRAAFRARGRTPRFEIVEAFAPALATALADAGFKEESRPFLMACGPDGFREPPLPEGVRLETLDSQAPDDRIRSLLVAQRSGFGVPKPEAVSEADVAFFRGTLRAGRAFLAYRDGEAVGGAVLLAPADGLAEVAGVATVETHRRRGIGTALTAAAAREAFALGVEVAILAAADERAGRVYQAVGFEPFGFVSTFVDAE